MKFGILACSRLLGHLRLAWLESSREDFCRRLGAAVLFVLLVLVAKATAPALEECAEHGLLVFHVQGSIPHELNASNPAASSNARDGFAATGVANFLVDLRSGAWAAQIVEETEWALWFEESGLPGSLGKLVGSHG